MPKRRRPPPPAPDGPSLNILLATHGAVLPSDAVMPLATKLTTIASRIEDLEAESSFINGLSPGDKTFLPQYTLAAASQAVLLLLMDLNHRLVLLETQFDTEKTLAKRMITRSGTDAAGDGNAYLQFVNISLGDCTLITSPTGKRILVDCGNSGGRDDIILNPALQTYFGDDPFEYVRHQVNNKRFLKGTKQIDILIFTHPDADHHNRAEAILESIKINNIGVTYYGGTEDFDCRAFGKTKNYVWLRTANDPTRVKKLVLREDDSDETTVIKTVNDEEVTATSGTAEAIGEEYLDPATHDIVLYFEDNFKVSVVAANVTGAWKGGDFYTKDKAFKGPTEPLNIGTPPNIRSLIVYVEAFGTKTLICGDATAVTEKVALNQFPSILSAVQVLRIGHHGSRTSSSLAFINQFNKVMCAIASTAGQTSRSRHHLPRQSILKLYQPLKAQINPKGKHIIYAWNDAGALDNLVDITDNLWGTGSTGTLRLNVRKPN